MDGLITGLTVKVRKAIDIMLKTMEDYANSSVKHIKGVDAENTRMPLKHKVKTLKVKKK